MESIQGQIFSHNYLNTWLIPKKRIPYGDIVELTSRIEGLDINHIRIIIWKDNEFYLLHGSQSEEKVMVSPEPLAEFLKPSSKNSGIMIARPVF